MLKKGLLSLALASSILTVGLSHTVKSVSAEEYYNTGDVKFTGVECSKAEGTGLPTTFILFPNEKGQMRKVPLFSWTSKYIKDNGWNPAKRCKVVTERINNEFKKENNFNFYLVNDVAKYSNSITGSEETTNVVCFTRTMDKDENGNKSTCSSIFITLSPTENPEQVLNDFKSMFSEAGLKPPSGGMVRGENGITKNYVGLHNLRSQFKKGLRNGTLKSYPAY